MIELRLDRALYAGTAVDAAMKTYGAYATFEAIEDPLCWVVRISAASPARERKVAGEFGNSALGLTVKARGKGQTS